MAEECYLEKDRDPYTKQCCCACEYLKVTHKHCTTFRKDREAEGKCICGDEEGYACTVFDRIYVNWPKHCIGCEMFTDKRSKHDRKSKSE